MSKKRCDKNHPRPDLLGRGQAFINHMDLYGWPVGESPIPASRSYSDCFCPGSGPADGNLGTARREAPQYEDRWPGGAQVQRIKVGAL